MNGGPGLWRIGHNRRRSVSVDAVVPDSIVIRGRKFARGSGCQEAPTYAVIPPEVLFDETLNHCDLRAYAILVYFRSPKEWRSEIGERRLSEAAGIDRRSLRKSIPKLIKAGHINRTIHGYDRSVYDIKNYLAELTPKSEKKSKSSDKKEKSAPVMKICGQCHRKVRGLGKTGVCRTCKSTANTERIARRIVQEELRGEKTA